MKQLLLAAMLPLLFGSCSSFKYTRLSGADKAPIEPETVTIYPRKSTAPANVQATGMVKYKCKKENKVWRKVRRIAASHGENAAYMELYKGKHDEFKHKGVIYTFNTP